MSDWRRRTGLVVGFWLASVAGAGADCLSPVLESVFPPEIRVGREGETRSITLFGEDLGFDPIWRNPGESSRCHSQVWVRPEGGGEADWKVAAGQSEADGAELAPGEGSRTWVRVDLSGPFWLREPGRLEFVVVRGILRTEGTLQEAVRSEPRRVAVVETVSYVLAISGLNPPAVRPGSPGLLVTLEGQFGWESEVFMDGKRIRDAVVQPGLGRIGVLLSADQLARPGPHVLQVRDPVGAVSNEALFHVEAPTALGRVSPDQLKQGGGRQTVRIRFEGAEPERIEVRFQPQAGAARVAASPQQEDFSEGFSKGKQVRSEAVEAGSLVMLWRPVEFRIQRGEVRFAIEPDLVPSPGVLVVRLSGRTGERAAVIPVQMAGAAITVNPTLKGGPPEKEHNFTERPKY